MNAAAIRPPRRWVWVLLALLLAVVLAVVAVWMLNLRGEAPVSDVLPQAPASAQTVERGQYLAPSQFEAAFVSDAHSAEQIAATAAAAAETLAALG